MMADKNYVARTTGKLLMAIADGDTATEIRLMRELTESVGVMAMVEAMASAAIESMKLVSGDDWRGALNMAILDMD